MYKYKIHSGKTTKLKVQTFIGKLTAQVTINVYIYYIDFKPLPQDPISNNVSVCCLCNLTWAETFSYL